MFGAVLPSLQATITPSGVALPFAVGPTPAGPHSDPFFTSASAEQLGGGVGRILPPHSLCGVAPPVSPGDCALLPLSPSEGADLYSEAYTPPAGGPLRISPGRVDGVGRPLVDELELHRNPPPVTGEPLPHLRGTSPGSFASMVLFIVEGAQR